MISQDLDCRGKNDEGGNSFDVERIKLPRAKPGSDLTARKYSNEQGNDEVPFDGWRPRDLPRQSANGIYKNEQAGQCGYLFWFIPLKKMKNR